MDVEQLQQQLKDSEVYAALLQAQLVATQAEAGTARDNAAQLLAKQLVTEGDHVRSYAAVVDRRMTRFRPCA